MPSNLFKFVKNRIPTLRATEFPRLSSSSTEEQCHADQFHPQRSSSRHWRATYEAEKPAGGSTRVEIKFHIQRLKPRGHIRSWYSRVFVLAMQRGGARRPRGFRSLRRKSHAMAG